MPNHAETTSPRTYPYLLLQNRFDLDFIYFAKKSLIGEHILMRTLSRKMQPAKKQTTTGSIKKASGMVTYWTRISYRFFI